MASYHFTFIIVGHGAHQLDLLSFCIVGEQLFLDLAFVIADHSIGHMQDIFGTPVVPFELDHFHIIIVFWNCRIFPIVAPWKLYMLCASSPTTHTFSCMAPSN